MKHSTSQFLAGSLVLVLAAVLPVAAQQTAPSTTPAALSPTEAFELLKGLNEKEALMPASFMLPLGKLTALTSERCFGIRLPNGLRLVGQSSGKDYGVRGSNTTSDGQRREKVLIGSFYSEFPFLFEAKRFAAGPYLVLVFRNALELHGDDHSGTHYDANRRSQVPNALVEEIPFRSPIPDELLAEKATVLPRFGIGVENAAVFLTLLDNKLRITPK